MFHNEYVDQSDKSFQLNSNYLLRALLGALLGPNI